MYSDLRDDSAGDSTARRESKRAESDYESLGERLMSRVIDAEPDSICPEDKRRNEAEAPNNTIV